MPQALCQWPSDATSIRFLLVPSFLFTASGDARAASGTYPRAMATTYLFIESRTAFDLEQVAVNYLLAADLVRSGHEAILYLIENGVLMARSAVQHAALRDTVAAGVQVLVDEFSARERGIAAAELQAGVRLAPLDTVVDHLERGSRVIWH